MSSDAVFEFCANEGVGFIPWNPLPRVRDSALSAIARELDATPGQVALGWLLRRSPVMLPIPGTSSVAHLEENVAAASLQLTDAQLEALAMGAR